MKFLRNLKEGRRFRPAYAMQQSLNRRPMLRDRVYRITKIFPQSPNTVISVWDENPNFGFYSLAPDTPVLLPRELYPTPDQVDRFLEPRDTARAVGYRLLWDGKMPIREIVSPKPAAVLRIMFAFGKKEYDSQELREIVEKNFKRFYGKPCKDWSKAMVTGHCRYLIDRGLIEEIL